MNRSIYLAFAGCGYLVAAVIALAGGTKVAVALTALASLPMLVWIIALGVTTGIEDARSGKAFAPLEREH